MDCTLIIGYGNPLRGDDGVAWHAVRALQSLWPEDEVDLRAYHQLLPELAEPISRAAQVIFIDAGVEGGAGQIQSRRVPATKEPARGLTHHLGASSLLALARALYGGCGQATLFSVTGASFDHGDALSPVVEAALPRLIDQVVRLVEPGEGEEASCTSMH